MSWYSEKEKAQELVLSTRVRLARNLEDFPFPSRMSEAESLTVLNKVKDAILSRTRDFTFYEMKDLSELEKQCLLEEHLISRELCVGGLHRGVLLNKDRTVSIMINEEDHIRLQCILPGSKMNEAWDIADKMDTLLGESLTYAFHESIGYLTACPTNVGTGMRVSAMVHLPSLTKTGNFHQLLNSIGKLGMTVRGLFGEGTEVLGNIYQISNQRTLGMSEEELLERFSSIMKQLVEKEQDISEKILESGDLSTFDRIHRAWGILTNARLLSSKEFMNLWSDVSWGKFLGILSDGPQNLTELLVLTQSATLSREEGKFLSPSHRDKRRAELVRAYLKGEH